LSRTDGSPSILTSTRIEKNESAPSKPSAQATQSSIIKATRMV
jgi:hypothetical protein